jgi:hypothetical protein
MNIKILITIVVSAVVAIFAYKFYENQSACKDPSAKVELVNVPLLRRGSPIYLRFKMEREGSPGCMTEKTSDSYKNIGCAFRTEPTAPWTAGRWGTIIDDETQYMVECQFPRLFGKNSINLEYALDYSAWGRPVQKTGAVAVQ